MLRTYYGLTDLEIELLDKIGELCEQVNSRDAHLVSANGYGIGEVYYRNIVESLGHVRERSSMNARLVNQQEFDDHFQVRKYQDQGEDVLHDNKQRCFSSVRGRYVKFIQENLGQVFTCDISRSAINWEGPLVCMPEIDISLPVTLFRDISPINKSSYVSATVLESLQKIEGKLMSLDH